MIYRVTLSVNNEWTKQMYLATSTPQSFGQDTSLPMHSSSWADRSLCGMSWAQDRQLTVLWGQTRRCWAISRWYARKIQPLTLNLHSTTFISQEGRCCSTADAKPVQLHPPGRETVDGHFISFRPIEPSTARFLTNGRSRVDLSTGQWVLTRCHCVMQSLQNEWPSWQVMGCLKTPWLNNEYIKAHASKY